MSDLAERWTRADYEVMACESAAYDYVLEHWPDAPENLEFLGTDYYDMSITLTSGLQPDAYPQHLIDWLHEQGFILVHFRGYPSSQSR